MGAITQPSPSKTAWDLARRQHDVIATEQLLALGYTHHAIKHRLARGRLHPTRWRGVYAVGRRHLTQHSWWMAAVLACGEGAFLTHRSAATLLNIRRFPRWPIEVGVPARSHRRRTGIRIHRRPGLPSNHTARHHGIPVTSPVRTLLDLATHLGRGELEAAVNEADKRELISPEQLRTALDDLAGQPGVKPLRALLDRHTFRLTDSELERRFLPLARAAGLPPAKTQHHLNGYRVDFYWPDLGLVVETDGLRYHRTPTQQSHDRIRDQAHAAAGLTPLRFTHAQVRFEPDRVTATLVAVARRLRPGGE